ncbi:MAG: DUF151 domain-containing protein [Sulfolobales archaeon]|nr:DUF151 domain-containing protein [Sulfolobales archaeon]MCG2893906.1 DUF151 domain-containing protein [Sulfolobales archaeon]MCG2910280.1 DUF151 domain-containing protein [Sulfolobales archaeon]
MKSPGREVLVKDVDAFIFDNRMPVMVLHLEDGRDFTMVNVEFLVVLALYKRNAGSEAVRRLIDDDRLTAFDFIASSDMLVETLKNYIDSVVIAELNEKRGTYTAYIRLKKDGIVIEKPMIPSHAVYLALVANKPIYVNEKLLEDTRNFEEPL